MFDANRISSLLRDVLYLLGALFVLYLLFWRGWILWILLIPLVLCLGFYVYVKVKSLKAARHSGSPADDRPERPAEKPRDEDSPIIMDDGKIQVTDLSGAKEVDFEKE